MQNNSNATNRITRFSDFATGETQFTGDKVALDKLINMPIIVKQFRINESKYKKTNAEKCMTMQFEYADNPGTDYVAFTGSNVLINQCEKYQEMMPFEARITKINRYYSFI